MSGRERRMQGVRMPGFCFAVLNDLYQGECWSGLLFALVALGVRDGVLLEAGDRQMLRLLAYSDDMNLVAWVKDIVWAFTSLTRHLAAEGFELQPAEMQFVLCRYQVFRRRAGRRDGHRGCRGWVPVAGIDGG